MDFTETHADKSCFVLSTVIFSVPPIFIRAHLNFSHWLYICSSKMTPQTSPAVTPSRCGTFESRVFHHMYQEAASSSEFLEFLLSAALTFFLHASAFCILPVRFANSRQRLFRVTVCLSRFLWWGGGFLFN